MSDDTDSTSEPFPLPHPNRSFDANLDDLMSYFPGLVIYSPLPREEPNLPPNGGRFNEEKDSEPEENDIVTVIDDDDGDEEEDCNEDYEDDKNEVENAKEEDDDEEESKEDTESEGLRRINEERFLRGNLNGNGDDDVNNVRGNVDVDTDGFTDALAINSPPTKSTTPSSDEELDGLRRNEGDDDVNNVCDNAYDDIDGYTSTLVTKSSPPKSTIFSLAAANARFRDVHFVSSTDSDSEQEGFEPGDDEDSDSIVAIERQDDDKNTGVDDSFGNTTVAGVDSDAKYQWKNSDSNVVAND